MSKADDLAEVLDEYATYLELDGQEGRAHAYDKAARTLRQARYVPPNPADLDGIGDAIRTKIAQYQRAGEIDELTALKNDYSWYAELRKIDGVGPKRARQMHEKLNIDTIDDVLLVGSDLTLLSGVGPKTASNILDAARDATDEQG
jgi:DNA polymerase IV (family X)